jgi:hypothetical protein
MNRKVRGSSVRQLNSILEDAASALATLCSGVTRTHVPILYIG